MEYSGESVEQQSQNTLESIRLRVRNERYAHRKEVRFDQIDALRLELGGIYVDNLRNYTNNDVYELIKCIKKRKRAKVDQMSKLCHAFIQSVDNISCFINIAGAINVIIKELTGNCFDSQILAAECICNLSLGSQIACEATSLCVGSYLITFLKSVDERLLRVTLWTITNLIASGIRSQRVFADLEIVKGLLNVNELSLSDDTRTDLHETIEIAIESEVFKFDDISTLLNWIASMNGTLSFRVTKILYKIFESINYQPNDDDKLNRITELMISTQFYLYKQMQIEEILNDNLLLHFLLILRIVANLISLKLLNIDHFLQIGFIQRKVSLGTFLNDLLTILMKDEASQLEVLWFGRVILENDANSIETLDYFRRENVDTESLLGAYNITAVE